MAEQTIDTETERKPAAERGNEQSGDAVKDNPRNKSRRRFIIILVVAVLLVGVLLFYWHSTFYQDTDDAQVNGHLIQISSRINGNVIGVPVSENQQVKAGDVLVELDPKDYQTTVQQDEANLAAAQSNYESNQVNVPVTTTSSTTNVSAVVPRFRNRMTLLCRRSANWKLTRRLLRRPMQTTSRQSSMWSGIRRWCSVM